MTKRKQRSPKPGRKRRAPKKVTEVFERCTITVQGNKVWMSGPLADELAEAARRAGMTFQDALIWCVCTSLPKVVAEFQAKRQELEQAKK